MGVWGKIIAMWAAFAGFAGAWSWAGYEWGFLARGIAFFLYLIALVCSLALIARSGAARLRRAG